MDHASFDSIAEDLAYLKRDWAKGAPNDVIRRGSAILRRFLVDGGSGVLLIAWRALGLSGQPVIPAPNLLRICGGTFEGVDVALAGGGDPGGVYAGGIVMVDGPVPRAPLIKGDENVMEWPWSISDYAGAPCAVVKGRVVKRRQVIKYFANYLGGVHLDSSSRIKKKEGEEIRRMQAVERQIDVYHQGGLHFELLSIGQALAKSEDLGRLANVIRTSHTDI